MLRYTVVSQMMCFMSSYCYNVHFVTVSSDPVDLQSFGDVVVWNEPLNPNGQITEYEIQFFIPDTQLRITRSRNSQGTFYTVQGEDRLGENAHFRVRILLPITQYDIP